MYQPAIGPFVGVTVSRLPLGMSLLNDAQPKCSVQVGTEPSATPTCSSEQGVRVMAGSLERLGSQGWTDNLRLHLISKVTPQPHVMLNQLHSPISA